MDFRNITNTINEYTEQTFGLVADCGLDFAFYPDACVGEPDVTYSLIVTERFDRLYSKFIEEKFGVVVPVFLISLLHEVGHYFTNDYWTNTEQRYFAKQKELLNPEDDIDTLVYFQILDEYYATKWAIEYIQEHPQEIEEFWNKVRAQIENFYKENGYEV